MTRAEFIREIQGVFGANYNQYQLKHVKAWLETISEKALPFLWKAVNENVSWMYNRPPGLKELNEAKKVINQRDYISFEENQQILIDEDFANDEDAAEAFAALRETLDSLSTAKNIKKKKQEAEKEPQTIGNPEHLPIF